MTIYRLIAIVIILFIALILGFYLTYPKYQEFKELQINVSEKEAELRGRTAYFAGVNETFKKLKNYKKTLEKIDEALPSNPSIAFLIYFFQKKSIENDLILQEISFSEGFLADKKKEFKELHFSFSLLGSYSAFKNFLSSLEKSVRLIEVESISFISKKEIEEDYSFRLTVKVRYY